MISYLVEGGEGGVRQGKICDRVVLSGDGVEGGRVSVVSVAKERREGVCDGGGESGAKSGSSSASTSGMMAKNVPFGIVHRGAGCRNDGSVSMCE